MQTLRLFVDVARCQSFSQAANLHGVSQSAASQRIHQLEKSLGVTLIDRSQRPLRLTEQGERFFIGCQDILERYDRLELSICKQPSMQPVTLRVAAIYSAGIELLHNIRERFQKAHPHIEIELHYEHPQVIHQMVRDNQVDLGIVSYPKHWKGVEMVPLRDEMMVLVCSPQDTLASQAVVTPDDLTDRQMICLEPHLPVGRNIRQYLRKQDASVRIVESFDNIDTIKNAVAAIGHVAILPRRTILREAAAGTLSWGRLDPPLSRPIGIIHRKRTGKKEHFSFAAQVFINDLTKRVAEETDEVHAEVNGTLQPAATS